MVQEHQLSSVLSEFAHNLSTDFPIQAILDHLVERIVDVLPISAAGVTIIEPGRRPRYVAASDPCALRYEQLQTALGEGPCVMAYQTGEPVTVPDLSADDRFPRFVTTALAEGLAAVFTFPLRKGDRRLGALDLYRHSAGELSSHDMSAAQTLADVAGAYLLNAQARARDIERSEQFRLSAMRDPLTMLANRALLEQRLHDAAQRAGESHSTATVLFSDLDQFKKINDTYGHHVGDELLVAVAQRLSSLIRPGDTLSRVSGDEFVILCENLREPADAEGLARRIGEALSSPFCLADHELNVTASVGVAFAGPGEDVARGLLRDVDFAMYEAKRGGGARHHVFDDTHAAMAAERFRFERGLRTALAAQALELAYQPIVRSSDGLVTGVEALLRWTDPAFGTVPAPAIVAAAERIGVISELGTWVLETACRQRELWTSHCALDIAVNVSAVQLLRPGFRDSVAAVLDRTGTDAASVILEMTEGVFIEDGTRALDVLGDLKALRVRLALDDFGTGYSSLNYLRQFPVDSVKIDRVFVADLGQDAADTAIVAAVTNLAHVLELHVIAEGVESQQQRDLLVAMGCESSQGFYYARPMSPALLGQRLAEAGGAWHLPN